MEPLRIGIVGAGGIVRERHLPGLQPLGAVEVRAVANSTIDSALRFCKANVPAAEAVADWHDLVKRDDIDIVWIGATPQLHAPVTLAALTAGKHVFTQARMATNLEEARTMLAAAKARPDLVTMICPAPHGLRSGAYFKKLLDEETIGSVRMVRLQSLNGTFLDPRLPAHWRQRKEISGLNIMTLGIHIEVLQRWFGGIASVQAEGKAFVTLRNDYRVEVPDILNVLAEFENGAQGILEFSSVHSGDPVEAMEVIGSKGILRYDYAKDSIELQRKGDPKWQVLESPKELLRDWQVEK
ncbi:MAG: Gfo/Idh/MocA family oxidoreductase, partial [Chthoniobacterales bacterium]